MTCHEIVLRLSDHLDGLLPTEQAAELTGHLRACEACRGVFADLTRVRDAARNLGPITPPAHIWLEIAGRVQLDEAQARPRQPGSGWAWRRRSCW
jgi:anti-sigma factor RsiW